MKILVFEWLVGGGIADEAAETTDSFLVQGASMYGAIVEDCLSLGYDVLSPLDPNRLGAISNFTNFRDHENFHTTSIDVAAKLCPTLRGLADEADHVFLIAPECDGILSRCLQWLDEFHSKLVCGPPNLIEVCGDKNATARLLNSLGVAVATGVSLPAELLARRDSHALQDLVTQKRGLWWPLVVKPATGAGAENVVLCHRIDQLESIVAQLNETLRVERYIAGRSVSVSIVRSETRTRLLPGTEQQFSNGWDARNWMNCGGETMAAPVGHFVQSMYPLEEGLQHRAAALATAVAAALPMWRGYLGVDMVLADDGPDVVVELNPRLTVSYCLIRRETGFNLMEFLLDVKG